MEEVRKVIFDILLVMLFCVIIFLIVTFPYFQLELNGESRYQDAYIRRELAGELDFLISGASYAVRSFNPLVIDDEIGCNSYNLSKSLETMKSRKVFLEKEIKRNPVKTVVLEVSNDILLRDRKLEGPEGDLPALGALDSWGERIPYFISAIQIKEYGQVLSMQMQYGIYGWKRVGRGNTTKVPVAECKKGFKGAQTIDVSVSLDEFDSKYHKTDFDKHVIKKNVKILENMIGICQDNGIDVYLVVTPIAQCRIAQYGEMDAVYKKLKDIAEDNHVPYLDYNLYKDRNNYFSDQFSFYDTGHLSESGATVFSKLFAQTYNQTDRYKELFYDSYFEAEQNGFYENIYREQTADGIESDKEVVLERELEIEGIHCAIYSNGVACFTNNNGADTSRYAWYILDESKNRIYEQWYVETPNFTYDIGQNSSLTLVCFVRTYKNMNDMENYDQQIVELKLSEVLQ